MAKDKNFKASGVPQPIQKGAPEIKKKPMLKPMSDRTASDAGRWPPRGDNWSAPEPGTRYNPPPAEKVNGAATMSDNARAAELLKPDYSGRFFRK